MCEITSKLELKPCPLCGCDNVLYYVETCCVGHNEYYASYKVRCYKCGLTLSRLSKDDAVNTWNDRYRWVHVVLETLSHHIMDSTTVDEIFEALSKKI